MKTEAIGLRIPLIKKGDDLVEIIYDALEKEKIRLKDGDVVILTEKIVSKSEGREIALDKIEPSSKAKDLAKTVGKDPKIVELILRESKEILGLGENFILVETKHGFVCANAGIDQSNIEKGKAKLLPENPDKSAEKIRRKLEEKTRKKIGVVIVDSWGRPFRYGSVGVAIGASGVVTLLDRRGEKDIFGKELQVTRVALGDCVASMASLIFGEAREMVPVVIVRGLNILGKGSAKELIRRKEEDIFRSTVSS
jgi:coenzyme F420-0:L-glutamate ligase/coenzyme F420-1:gamma-L-glutamate ligase